MTDIDAEACDCIQKRLWSLEDRYVDRYPRWTVRDSVAASLVLQQAKRAQLMSQRDECIENLVKALRSIMNAYGDDDGASPEKMYDLAEAALKAMGKCQ